jgi:hypothetical protein
MISGFKRKVFLVMAILIASHGSVVAQSGRKGATRPVTPVPPQASTPTTPETKPQKSSRIQMLVGIQDPSPIDGVPTYLSDTVLSACLGRLNESAGVDAKGGSNRLSRGDAIKAAKAEIDRYVVWLELGRNASVGSQPSNNPDDLHINFMVLEPGTAKVKKSGSVQYASYKVGNVGVSGPTSRRSVYSDYAVKETARQAADRILAAFEIKVDGPWPRSN